MVTLTASQLREKITYLADVIKETKAIWDPASWPKVAGTAVAKVTPPAPAPAP